MSYFDLLPPDVRAKIESGEIPMETDDPPEDPRPEPRTINDPNRAYARRTDPETSHAAAAHASRSLTESQKQVLEMFDRYDAMTDVELVLAYDSSDLPTQADSGIRTRRRELVDFGLVENSGRKKVVTHHDPAIIWRRVR